MPQASAHRQTYATEFMERMATSKTEVIDGVEAEKGIIPRGEKMVLSRLNIQDKFTLSNMHNGFKLGSIASLGERREVKVDMSHELNFRSTGEWELRASRSRALYTSRESTMHLLDAAQKREIMSRCPNLSGDVASGIYMTSIHERLSIPIDMRHIFTKMYLYLMDYTLAVISKLDELEKDENLAFDLRANITPTARLATAAKNDIVIDATLFTKEELGLLGLSAAQYPSVWYAGDNIYNSCQMESDDVVFISSGDIEVDGSFLWGSPDRMYHMMWTIAARLGAIGCLTSVIETMRGKPKMVSDMMKYTNDKYVHSMMPKSFNISTAFGSNKERYSMGKMPGYASTSIGMVADLLYGMGYKALTSCVAESLGALGKVVSSSTPQTCGTINGIFRDYGLQHTSVENNYMLQNWEIFSGGPMTWELGVKMKEYALGVATDINNGVDLQLPAILFCLPGFTAINTAFGAIKGWFGGRSPLESDEEERMEYTDLLAAVGWMLGMRTSRPLMFHNRLGKKQAITNAKERGLEAKCERKVKLHDVEFFMEQDVGGRVDENEEVASNLFRTEYSGTKCSLVYSYQSQAWISAEPQKYDRFERETLRGDISSKERKTMAGLRTTPIVWGAQPTQSELQQKSLEQLRTLSRGNQIVPSLQPKHTRIDVIGTKVPRYTEDGEIKDEHLPYKAADVEEGAELHYSRISVPGDGQCGIHAVAKDLAISGRLSANEMRKAEEVFSGDIASQSFHDVQEIAAQCQKWGFGLQMLDVGTKSLWDFSKNHDYKVTLVRENDHFEAARFGRGANTTVVEKIHKQEAPGEEFIKKVESYGTLFGGK